ncbi:MAG: hypothetical protein JSC188_000436 [Candidatus Tokpelaia sp. JSC188]|nr:MAG: hypothetical protein JSC188_000436 [Candidatus Tokpelaia sp. JSC188]
MRIKVFVSIFSLIILISTNTFAQNHSSIDDKKHTIVQPIKAVKELKLKNIKAEFTVDPHEPAPPLTQMWVNGVLSSKCGKNWEEFPRSGTSATSCGHGGPLLRVAVLEIGYGSSHPSVRYQDNPLGSAYETEPLCDHGSGTIGKCSRGQTVAAFKRYYNLDGRSVPGYFTYENTSINAPRNTMFTSINILP